MAAKTHVIELTSPAFIRPRYVRRHKDDGGFVVTTHQAKARRYAPSAAANAAADLRDALAAAGFTPCVVPVAAVEATKGGQS